MVCHGALGLDQAAALVLMERRGINEVLTIDPLYDVIDVDVLTR
jgi:predicted nucleic acid-binding protein